MLTWMTRETVMRKYAKWNAKQLDCGEKNRRRSSEIFRGMLDILDYVDKENHSLKEAMTLIDEEWKHLRWNYISGLRLGLTIIINCYVTDVEIGGSVEDPNTHFYTVERR